MNAAQGRPVGVRRIGIAVASLLRAIAGLAGFGVILGPDRHRPRAHRSEPDPRDRPTRGRYGELAIAIGTVAFVYPIVLGDADAVRSPAPGSSAGPAARRRAAGRRRRRRSLRASGPARRSRRSPVTTSAVAVVAPVGTCLVTATCVVAWAATWARWVTTSTWWRRPTSARAASDRRGCGAADAGVDLVEHERPRIVVVQTRREHEAEGQHRPGQLAARRHLGERQQRRTRVGREQELDPVAGGRSSACSPTSMADLGVGQRQLSQAGRDGGGEQRARRVGGPPDGLGGGPLVGDGGRRAARVELGRPLVESLELVESAHGLVPVAHDLGQVVAVLAAQVAEQLPASAHLGEPLRILLDGFFDVTDSASTRSSSSASREAALGRRSPVRRARPASAAVPRHGVAGAAVVGEGGVGLGAGIGGGRRRRRGRPRAVRGPAPRRDRRRPQRPARRPGTAADRSRVPSPARHRRAQPARRRAR